MLNHQVIGKVLLNTSKKVKMFCGIVVMIQCCSTFVLKSRNRIQIFQEPIDNYRFSAFWLRSKCSICSYQLNIWYVLHRRTTILNWFLELGEVSGACSAFATGWPGIAVPPGPAHSPRGFINTFIFFTFFFSTAWLNISANHMAVSMLTMSANRVALSMKS